MSLRLRLAVAGLALAYPLMAYAHSPYPGIRGFYVGVLHPLSTPSHVLLILGISLLVGTRVRESRFACLRTLFICTGIGLILAFAIAVLLPTASLVLILLGALGLLLVFPRDLPGWTYQLLTGLSGLLLALESIPDPGPVLDVFITTFGSLVGIHYLIMYTSRGVAMAWAKWRTPVTEIGVRVAGSWLTAIAVLMLAFNVTGAIQS